MQGVVQDIKINTIFSIQERENKKINKIVPMPKVLQQYTKYSTWHRHGRIIKSERSINSVPSTD
jgi:hypothetical protein